jgi:transposase
MLPNIDAEFFLADKAYDADARVLDILEAKGIVAVIPPKSNRIIQRDYDKEIYKTRHLIENFFCKLKQFRAIATRYHKTVQNFLSAINLASITIWLN